MNANIMLTFARLVSVVYRLIKMIIFCVINGIPQELSHVNFTSIRRWVSYNTLQSSLQSNVKYKVYVSQNNIKYKWFAILYLTLASNLPDFMLFVIYG